MNVNIVREKDFTLAGKSIQTKGGGDPKINDISQLWERFNPEARQINAMVNPENYYGFMYFPHNWKNGDDFTYLCSAEVSSVENLPEGMESYHVPAQTYAVIEYQGLIDHIGEVYDYYYREWLPNSDYMTGSPFNFEKYDERFIGNDQPESVVSFYFPIVKKHID